MPRLTPTEVDRFLDEPGHLVRVATIRPDGSPLVVPTWFLVADERVLITPRVRSGFLADIERDPRVCLSIDEAAHPFRKVTVRGCAEVVFGRGDDDGWRDLYRAMALRYMDESDADAYLALTHDVPRVLIGVGLAAPRSEVTTWRLPLAHEDPTTFWARRYWGLTEP
jgi:nitroimidazol reductase NimA-like FMN-containing flavoprotein (pyridoxamine 5'-phosphate oxidase superfamily)